MDAYWPAPRRGPNTSGKPRPYGSNGIPISAENTDKAATSSDAVVATRGRVGDRHGYQPRGSGAARVADPAPQASAVRSPDHHAQIPADPNDFGLVTLTDLLGLRILEACGASLTG